MDVKVPSAGEGDYDVKIMFKNKESQAEEIAVSPNKFKIKSLIPIIESYSPNKIGPGYPLTLTGKNFSTEQNTVVFSDDDLDHTATILSMTATELKIKTPAFAGAAQVYKNYDIVVFSTINGEQRRSERKTIAVIDEPYIIEVDPINSKMSDIITIKGFNFNPPGIDAVNFPIVTFSADGNISEIKGIADLEQIDDETIKVKVPDSGRYDVLWNRVRVKTADYKVSNYADIKVVRNP
jgi:hypothetical protein